VSEEELAIHKRSVGGQGGIFTVRRRDAQTIWNSDSDLIVKVFHRSMSEVAEAASDEFETLRVLRASLHGNTIDGWTIHCPLPLFLCRNPDALVMTRVPGRSLSGYLDGHRHLSPETLNCVARIVIDALGRYWSSHGRVYGDLNFHNILCDLPAKTLSFVDCGMAHQAWRCESVGDQWYPASRDLAYMLYSTTVAVRAFLGKPAARRRHEWLVDRMLQWYVAGIESPRDKRQLLEEIRACAQVHLDLIEVSGSPAGLWRRFVKRTASRSILRILGAVGADVGQRTECAVSHCQAEVLR
jgi:hypothetical protein